MPRETVGINLTSLPVYEAGAVFLSSIAHPHNETDRQNFWIALCRQTIIQTANQDGDWAWCHQLVKPGFFIIDDETATKQIKRGFRLLNERIIAGRWYLRSFLQKRRSNLKVGDMALSALPDLQELSKQFGPKNKWRWGEDSNAPINNIEHRIFKRSRPVVHAAAALADLAENADKAAKKQGARDTFRRTAALLLHYSELLSVTVDRSEKYRLLLPRLNKPGITDDETIQFLIQ